MISTTLSQDASPGDDAKYPPASSEPTSGSTNMATEEPQQQSRLLTIIPEIRNAIYELSPPTGTTILLRPENILAKDGSKAAIHFHPSLPALYSVCRQMRAEYPLIDYYKNNTFLFTDGMLYGPEMLDEFVAARGHLALGMTSVRVNMTAYFTTRRIRDSSDRRSYTIRFSMKRNERGLATITDLTGWSMGTRAKVRLCFCKLAELVPKSKEQHDDLVTVLKRFAEHYSANNTQTAKIYSMTWDCARCGEESFQLE
ncbi:hypothetical protein LTR17_021830 [Elasticomyces elasticus]|nr:hypothetical protein LTR17_021830 [Elasticomyces elasticus]